VIRSHDNLNGHLGSHSNDPSSPVHSDEHLNDLITEYKRSTPKFEKMAEHARDLCEEEISKQLTPIPAIIDQRCKDPISLRVKMQTKYKSGVGCSTFQHARKKWRIPDLAAMRIALYYPNQNEEVKKFLKGIFIVVSAEKPRKPSGYVADHYTVRFKEDAPKDKKGHVLFHQDEDDVVEIQVVSVLSHTWSQVEHKIKYKRKAYTPLSPTEQRILKGLSGLVGSGDLLLEELYDLQQQNSRVFEDEYALGGWLWKYIPKDSPLCMGVHRASDQKILRLFLNVFKFNTPDDLGQVLKQICPQEKDQDAQLKLENIRSKYKPSEPRLSIYLMDYIISIMNTSELDQALAMAKHLQTELAYRCQTVLNSLNWLHELFDESTEDDQFSAILTEYHSKGSDERMSLQWAYTDIARESMAKGDEAVPSDAEKIQKLWQWMGTTDCPALRLVFQIAQRGVWQESIPQLLRQLSNRQPYYIHSRESTRNVGDTEE
jgi:ppGpp synthetase/RelA/SpoT-type nucleotidyltranferase